MRPHGAAAADLHPRRNSATGKIAEFVADAGYPTQGTGKWFHQRQEVVRERFTDRVDGAAWGSSRTG